MNSKWLPLKVSQKGLLLMAKLPALFIVFTLMLGLTKTHVAWAKTQLTEQFFQGVLTIVSPKGEVEKRTLKPLKREYNIQRIEGIAKKIMNPNKKANIRVGEDNKKIKAARTIDSNLTAFAQGFIAPIEGTITGVYGSQRYYNGVPKWPHYGLDYAGNTGDPVKAPADGVVLMFVPDMFYSGGTMIIDHGHGVSSTFLHLSDSYVKVGDKVSKGQVVAAVGSSGRATGPHLDWRINWFNVRLDPALVLKLKPLE